MQRNEFEAHSLLRTHELPDGSLVKATGVANDVWLTPNAVIRLNGGRFRDAFKHEARILDLLPADISHPGALAHGLRQGGGEYLILERVSGSTLDEVWPQLARPARRQVVHDLAGMVQRLHALPLVPAMENPWVQDALTIPKPGDAYHAPPTAYPMLVTSAAAARPDLADLIADLGSFIETRMGAFDSDARSAVLVHADLHFRNVLFADGEITGLIDFEGSRPAAADVELDMLVRFLDSGRQFGSGVANDYADVLAWFREAYPQLFAHPQLRERLEVYEGLWQLVQLHHWRPEYVSMPDPAAGIRRLLAGDFRERLDGLLAPRR